MTRAEVKDHFRILHSENSASHVLKILAATEARLRLDYIERAQRGKRRLPITQRLRGIWKKYSENAHLEADIIESWKAEVDKIDQPHLSKLKAALKYRHWLAHGRYWPLKSGYIDFFDAEIITTNALMVCGINAA
jgi:hypothetical protein